MTDSPMQQVRLEDIVGDFDDIHGLVDCEDPKLLGIFGYEQADAGLAHTDIALMVPEEPERYPYHVGFSNTYRSDDGTYIIEVTIPEKGFLKYFINPFFFPPDEFFRRTVREELEYIRNGDCDRVQGPFFQCHPTLQGLYYAFIAKPRAIVSALLR
ncbi:MAG TPA: hypothetical protein VJK52_02975 [Candidatus Nanoarchaeia archaeon]|nr:hypothetical protein [Candidatus Nanoarchaeia archaeon]